MDPEALADLTPHEAARLAASILNNHGEEIVGTFLDSLDDAVRDTLAQMLEE